MSEQHPLQATALAHANIALVKYWGKYRLQDNVPAVPSLSMTLDALYTSTTVSFDPNLAQDEVWLEARLLPAAATARVIECVERLRQMAGCSWRVQVKSRNNFPMGAGLASSASAFAALVKACATALALPATTAQLSQWARMASASAARSMYGGFVGLQGGLNEQQQGFAAEQLLPEQGWPLQIVVAIVAEQQKLVGSTQGMEHSRLTSPFYAPFVASSQQDYQQAALAIAEQDFAALAKVATSSAMKMHSVAWTSQPPLLYWQPGTVALLHKIQQLQQDGLAVFATMDAGPQVKAVCLPSAVSQVMEALEQLGVCQRLVCSGLGPGAQVTVHGN